MTQVPVDTAGTPPLAYGATLDTVRALVLDVAAEGVRIGQRAERVSDERLRAWLEEAAGVVATRTHRADELPPLAAAGTLSQALVDGARRHLVELYAAALLADVTHPERAQAGTSPGGPLMDRFWKLLDQLTETVATALDTAGAGDPTAPAVSMDLPAYAFPDAPLVTRRLAF